MAWNNFTSGIGYQSRKGKQVSNEHSDNGPAFPVPMVPHDSQGGYTEVRWQGMSLRAYFAGQAMVGLLAGGADDNFRDAPSTAMDCVDYADALIAALNRPAQSDASPTPQ